ncbi:MAG: hypothetical protein Q8Q89_02900 [bacterium]|nr:hypothetical protein [bacterium]
MYNWSTDPKELEKDKEKYIIWKLEQMVNFGLAGEKIDKEELKTYWSKLNLDPHRRRLLELFLNE